MIKLKHPPMIRLNDFCYKKTILTLFFVILPAAGAQQPVSIQLRHDTLTELVSAEVAKENYQDVDYLIGEIVRMIPVNIVKGGELVRTGLLPHSFFSKPPQALRYKKDNILVESDLEVLPENIIEQISHKISCEQLIAKALTKSVFKTTQQDVKNLKDELESLNENIATVFKNQQTINRNIEVVSNKISNSQSNWLVEQMIRAITPIVTALTVVYIVHKDAVKECIPIVVIVTIGVMVVYSIHCDKEIKTSFWNK